MKKRVEYDTLGEVEVPSEAYYGAQTHRSSQNFNMGNHPMPPAVIRALAMVKKGAAEVNYDEGLISKEICELIVYGAERIITGELSDHFPLSVWQTGSGTQTNMNVNEVIANLAAKKVGKPLGGGEPLHPIDHVNKSQSSNDVYPAAMSIAAVHTLTYQLLPKLKILLTSLRGRQKVFGDVIKTGRTHLMDATPITFGQEFSGYITQLEQNYERIENSIAHLSELAVGGTAVGTGLNTPKGFGKKVAKKLAKLTSLPLQTAPNKFSVQAAHDAFVASHATVKTLAVSLLKIATDLAWMVSGPTCGLCELTFPANEPGSSIMAGKVNPTQCEAMIMICTHVMGNDTSISIAGSRGNFELNVLKPLIIHNFLESATLLGDCCDNFATHFVDGLEVNHRQVDRNLEHSLMLVTALIPKIGYDNAAKVAYKASKEHMSLKQAVISLNLLSDADYDKAVDPKKMV